MRFRIPQPLVHAAVAIALCAGTTAGAFIVHFADAPTTVVAQPAPAPLPDAVEPALVEPAQPARVEPAPVEPAQPEPVQPALLPQTELGKSIAANFPVPVTFYDGNGFATSDPSILGTTKVGVPFDAAYPVGSTVELSVNGARWVLVAEVSDERSGTVFNLTTG